MHEFYVLKVMPPLSRLSASPCVALSVQVRELLSIAYVSSRFPTTTGGLAQRRLSLHVLRGYCRRCAKPHVAGSAFAIVDTKFKSLGYFLLHLYLLLVQMNMFYFLSYIVHRVVALSQDTFANCHIYR